MDDAAKEGGTLGVIEELEAQLKLREEEAREFQAWEQTMRAIGTPDAISEVEEARPEFPGVPPAVDDAVAADVAPVPESDAPELPSMPESDTPEPRMPEPGMPEELYRPPTGWFIPVDDAPPLQFSDAEEGSDAALPTEVAPAPVTGAFVLPEQPLAAWPAPQWDEPEAVSEPTDDLATGDLPMDAAPVWDLDDDPEPEPSQSQSQSQSQSPSRADDQSRRGSSSPSPSTSHCTPRIPSRPSRAASPSIPRSWMTPQSRSLRHRSLRRRSSNRQQLGSSAPVDAAPDGDLVDAPSPVQQGGFPLGEQSFASAEVVAAPSSFDDLLAGSPEEGEPVGIDREPEPRLPAESLFIEPLPRVGE